MRTMLSILILFWCQWASAIWSLPLTNNVDWKNTVGVQGGIPTNYVVWTNLTTLDATGVTNCLYMLSNAVVTCPTNGIIQIPSGTFNMSGTLVLRSFVIIRGAGRTNTILKPMPTIWMSAYGTAYATYKIGIFSGSSVGSTSIVMAATPTSLEAGNVIQINELNDGTWVHPEGQTGNADECIWSWQGYGDENDGGTRNRSQMVQVKSVSGTNVTFYPALFSSYARTPLAEYPTLASSTNNVKVFIGIEDLTLDDSGNTAGTYPINFLTCANCWMKNVRCIVGNSGVSFCHGFFVSYRNQIDSCDFLCLPSIQGSAIVLGTRHDSWLIQNCIFTNVWQAIVLDGTSCGHVFAYNYVHSLEVGRSTHAQDIAGHTAHPQFNLFEGNKVFKVHFDNIHGSSSHQVVFRNQMRGGELNSTWGQGGLWVDTTNYYVCSVGNVFASLAHSNAYRSKWTFEIVKPNPLPSDDWFYVYRTGYAGNSSNCPSSDVEFLTNSMVRHMNYNHMDNSVEKKSGQDESLPSSLYLDSKPSWFGALAWPPIGPDATGYATNEIPAEYRFRTGSDPAPAAGGTSARSISAGRVTVGRIGP